MAKIIVRGPALSQSGYGEHCRSVLTALKETDHDIYLINVGWGETGWIYEDTEERRWIDSLIIKTAQQEKPQEFDLSIQVQLPVEWQNLASKNIGVTAGVETDCAPQDWKDACKAMNQVIVPSRHSALSLMNEDTDNISIVGYQFRGKNTKFVEPLVGAEVTTKKNFLSVAQWSPRKNIEQTISSFVQEFMLEDVGLIVKLSLKNGSNIDRHYTIDRIKTFLGAAPSTMKCKIYLLHGTMTADEMLSLYADESIIGYVTSSHGEGFGLPAFEAACAGLPIIAPNWGGLTEFTSNGDTVLISEVDYEVRALEDYHVWNGVLNKDTNWCYADTVSLRSQMRNLYNNTSDANKQAKKLKTHLSKKFANKQINKQYNNIIDKVLNTEGDKQNET